MATVARRRAAPAVAALPAVVTSPDRFLNRELSTLQFNERVLALAEDPETPLLERVKFAAIFAANLDEFFQVRVAGLKRQVAAGTITTSPDGLTAAQQLHRIDRRVRKLAARHARLFADDIRPALAEAGVPIVRWSELDDDAQTTLRETFNDQIFPVLTPLAVDPGHPFPYISNLSLNLAVLVRDQASRRRLFARIKVPPLLPRFMHVPGNGHGPAWVPLEDVIAANLDSLFPGMIIAESWSFRVTRHSDLEIDDDEAEDLLETIEEELRRQRFSRAVRLEVEEGMPDHVISLLTRELQVNSADAHELAAPLGLTDLWSMVSLDRPDLKPPPFHPVTPRALAPTERRPGGRLRRPARLRRARPPPVRLVRRHGAGLHRAGRGRSIGPGHQADAVPHVGREPHRRRPDPGRGRRQAGGGPGRAQGATGRGGEHRLGPQAGAGRLSRGVRAHRPEDPLQGLPRRPPGGQPGAALRPHRHRELQPLDRA